MKLYYAAQPGYTARELAAVGAVCWLNEDARATADLVNKSRHPAYPSSDHGGVKGGLIFTQTPGDDVAPVAAWLTRSVDPAAVNEWLEARGWENGQLLPHSECPIDPGHISSSAQPVRVGDEGIFCFSCAGRGMSRGRKPGFVPYCSLVGGVPVKTAVMLKNAVHWTHARLVLREESDRLPVRLCRHRVVSPVPGGLCVGHARHRTPSGGAARRPPPAGS
jgi:hypothetical protein